MFIIGFRLQVSCGILFFINIIKHILLHFTIFLR
jgi:hypothetical protein